MDQSYLLNHLGEERENYYQAVSPPIIQSSNFSFPNIQAMRAALQKEFENPFYTRGVNPTVAILRKKLAALENAEDALVFASGSAAIAAGVMSVVKAGDHIVCVQKPYSWTDKLLKNTLSELGVTHTMVDGKEVANFENAIRENTRLILLESPNSLTFELQDIEAVANLAKSKGITTLIDNSYSSPLYQNPIDMGIDLVAHSASKYLNGHSDIVAGVLCGSKERIDRIFQKELMTFGGIISPNDAWLMMRGLRTLPLRMDRSSDSTEKVVEFLEFHPAVDRVAYPHSPMHPQHELAKKQMKRSGGLFSMWLRSDDLEKIEAFVNRLKYFQLACSWGGHESLAFPMCVFTTSQSYQNPDLPPQLIRFYIGLEDPEILIRDLQNALDVFSS